MVVGFAEDSSNTAAVVIAVFLVLAALLLVALWVAAFVSVLRQDRLTGGGKLLWLVVIIAFPFLGSIGWFAFGRTARLVNRL
ncbi:PLDc N-terminal domain-containing protein [Saccharothrix obliqua]|uniref:PLDc N-terminal domain-containing protein n=1 Tax=Saccharothrix obliqua TaxID=2861747 RepID=UPI001C5DF048|nr:PLDc N-terminal domain-containing protein [Saccharothrix obliqua]MBW4720818.1 PLD nuclease N-terminal domain-containing protein [Saccharothrix obliqua]